MNEEETEIVESVTAEAEIAVHTLIGNRTGDTATAIAICRSIAKNLLSSANTAEAIERMHGRIADNER